MAFDTSDEETLIGVAILHGVYIFLFTPLTAYYIRKIWTLYRQNEPFITKRRPLVTIVSSVFLMIYGAVIKPITDYVRATHDAEWSPSSTKYQVIFALIQLAQFASVFICVRLWLLFYDYKHQIYGLNHRWKVTITKNEQVSSWTHTHKWLGDAKIVSALGIFFAVLVQSALFYMLSFCDSGVTIHIIAVLQHEIAR